MKEYRLPDYLNDIEEAIKIIRDYVAESSWADFESNKLLQDGTIRRIAIIGENFGKILHQYQKFAKAMILNNGNIFTKCATSSFTTTAMWTLRRCGTRRGIFCPSCSGNCRA